MAPSTARTGKESAHRLSDCVTALLRDQPFFGSLALRLPIRADASRETLASDGHEIRYSPQWVADTDADLILKKSFRHMLRCLTIGPVVARPAVDGPHPVQFRPLCL